MKTSLGALEGCILQGHGIATYIAAESLQEEDVCYLINVPSKRSLVLCSLLVIHSLRSASDTSSVNDHIWTKQGKR